MAEKKINVESLQKDVNKLIKKRIELLRQLALAENKKSSYAEEIKSVRNDLNGVDQVMKEKFEELNKSSPDSVGVEETEAPKEMSHKEKIEMKLSRGSSKVGNYAVKT